MFTETFRFEESGGLQSNLLLKIKLPSALEQHAEGFIIQISRISKERGFIHNFTCNLYIPDGKQPFRAPWNMYIMQEPTYLLPVTSSQTLTKHVMLNAGNLQEISLQIHANKPRFGVEPNSMQSKHCAVTFEGDRNSPGCDILLCPITIQNSNLYKGFLSNGSTLAFMNWN